MRLPVTPISTVWRRIRDAVQRRYPRGRTIVAVDGLDGAGKSTFARGLVQVFAEDGVAAFQASIDGFHRPRVERYARGRRDPEGFYRDSYDYATFRRVLIDPFRDGAQTAGTTGFQLAAFDVVRDAPVESEWVSAPIDAVLIVDGIFLHRPELRDLWDWSLWLDVPVEIAYARMAERDGSDPDPDAAANARYRLGQQLYLGEASPRARATMVVDNSDAAHPVIVEGRA
ncbi:hypothetical protein GCM10022200_00040 [Microbacterium awajiense]|uniref:Phosphoribulokinase/uridine kinase domain-containing protein n=1 Tax=Microbacterium awajiense TaxID=415214 RepID=A0ABP6ZX81_9MICO